jgi:hypothetical protein
MKGTRMAIRILKSAVIGMLLAIAVGVLAYAVAPFFDVVGIYAAPGIMFLPLIPSKLVYWLGPNEGPAVGIFLLLLCATFFWTVLFGAAHFGWVSFRLRRQ